MIKFIDPIKNKDTWDVFKMYYPEGFQAEDSDWNLVGVVDYDEDLAVGAFAFIEEPDRYLITWLYVPEEMQRNGIGTAIIDWFMNYIGQDFKAVEAEFTGEEENLKDFFEARKDFDVRKVQESYRVNYDQLTASEKWEQLKEKNALKAMNFFELSEKIRENIYDKLAEAGKFYIDNHKDFEEMCEQDLCFCTYTGDAKALILTCYKELDDYEIAVIYAEDAESFYEVFAAFAHNFVKLYPGCNLIINPQSEIEKKIVDYYFPERTVLTDNYLAEWNYETI